MTDYITRSQTLGGPAPKVGSYEYNNMIHFFSLTKDDKQNIIPYHSFPHTARTQDTFKPTLDSDTVETLYSDPFYHNYRTMKDFFAHLQDSPNGLGFMEGIGVYEVFGAQFCSSPYMKYTKDTMQSGTASLTAVPLPIKAWPWDRKNNYLKKDTKFGAWTTDEDSKAITEGYILKQAELEGAIKAQIQSNILDVATDKEGLFKGQWPQYNVSVAFVNYKAEIALKIDSREIYQYAYDPRFAQQVMTSVMGMSNAAYINNLSTFCNLVIGGIPRGGPPPELLGKYGDAPSSGQAPAKSPMYEFIQIPLSVYNEGYNVYSTESLKNIDARTKIIGDGLRKFLYDTVHVDFASLSSRYNPAGVEVLSNSCTAFIDSHYRHEFDHSHLASVNNPNYLLNTANDENTPGHKVKLDYGWVPGFPKMGTALFASPGYSVVGSDKLNHIYKQICMVTDDLNPAIRPVTKPVTVTTFFNPQDETTTVFTHYEMLVEFRPQFNRKYLFLDVTDKDAITADRVVNW